MKLPAVTPTVIDRLVGYFDPARAVQRHRARTVLAMVGGYTGARRDRRATSQWFTTSGSPDADLLPDLPTLRDRSRDLERNAPLASGAISTNVTNIVGTGLEPQSQIDREILGLSDAAADKWQRAAEREYWLWASSQDSDASRTIPFSAQQAVALRSAFASGDVFALRRYIERPGNPYGLSVQLIEADRIANPGSVRDLTALSNGNRVSGGVEVDRDGAPIAYHVLRRHPGDLFGTLPRESDRIEAFEPEGGRRMLHVFDWTRRRPDQSRGAPYLASVIEPFKMLDRYSEAELMAAVVSAMFTVFIETESGTGDLAPLEPTSETGGTASDKDWKLASGAVFNLMKGEKISTANPGRPNSSFDPFTTAILQQIGVGLELPFEVLTKRFMSSYSAAKGALLEAWKSFRMRRSWLAEGFCQPVYGWVIEEAVARGRLQAPGFFEDRLIRAAYLGSKWIGPPAGHLDPEAEISAAEKRIALAVSTGAQETAEITGGDIEANIKQLGRERELRRAAGLDTEAIAERIRTEPQDPQQPPPARDDRAAERERQRKGAR